MALSEGRSPVPDEDPEAIAKALELELIQRRSTWQKAKARRQRWRTLSILFVLLVLLGALVAYFYFVPELAREEKSAPAASQRDR